jgi:hypothetical protein
MLGSKRVEPHPDVSWIQTSLSKIQNLEKNYKHPSACRFFECYTYPVRSATNYKDDAGVNASAAIEGAVELPEQLIPPPATDAVEAAPAPGL